MEEQPHEAGHLIPRKAIPRSSAQSTNSHDPTPDGSKLEHSELSPVGKARPSSASYCPRWLRDWWLELLCCILFTAAMVTIVGVILPYQDQPLPHWPYDVSINTLISILIAIVEAAVLFVVAEGLSQLKWSWFRRERPLQDMARFDVASRGLWGGLRLLLSLRGRDLVASMGAAVTVASIAVDPFAQV